MNTQNPSVGFRAVDQTSDPQFYIRLLDESGKTDSLQASQDIMVKLIDAQKGHRILDVGCGVGADAMELAKLVGSEGIVIGVDNSETMIEEAKKRSAGSGLPVEWRVGDAHSLDFDDDTFDCCRSQRVLGHVEDPGKCIAEMIRVIRPGGLAVVGALDVDAWILNTPDIALNRKVIHALCDSFRNGCIGRQLPGMFRNSGLIDTFVIPYTITFPLPLLLMGMEGVLKGAQEAGALTADEVSKWVQQLKESEQDGSYFGASVIFFIGGRKPAKKD